MSRYKFQLWRDVLSPKLFRENTFTGYYDEIASERAGRSRLNMQIAISIAAATPATAFITHRRDSSFGEKIYHAYALYRHKLRKKCWHTYRSLFIR